MAKEMKKLKQWMSKNDIHCGNTNEPELVVGDKYYRVTNGEHGLNLLFIDGNWQTERFNLKAVQIINYLERALNG